MIVETQVRDIQRSSSFEEKTMGLAKGSEAFVFNVLRKDLYSDPIGSLIREYTVNAQDEHRKHGKSDTPILIHVPNQFTPELHIRDFAGGLTEEQVFEFFGNYGASDKRDSNVAVGFFGLGCKSAFAYTDSYIVKSFKDGMEYTFNIYIDETEIGKTAKISAEPTTEPNGVKIIVPVKTHDIQTFVRKVLSTVNHFKVKPTIEGLSYVPTFEDRKPIISGEDWKYFGSGTPNVIMGEIAYPVDVYKMGTDLENWESTILRSDIHINVNIGDVQVTASREALQMTAKTIATIRQKLATIKATMVSETEKAFKDAKNLIEAKTLWYKLIANGGGYSNIIKACTDGIKWKGEDLKSYIITLDKEFHKVVTYENRGRRGNFSITAYYGTNIECTGDTIYFDDTDKANVGYKRRARTLLNAGARRVVVIETLDKKALEDTLGMKVTDLASFSAIVPTKATSTRTGGTGTDLAKRAKHTSKVFVLNLDNLKTHNYSASSEVWDVKEVDNLKGVYIPIDRFKPIDVPKIYDLDRLATIVRDAEQAGISIDIPIYGIKKGMDTSGLVRFDEWMKAKVEGNKDLIARFTLAKSISSFTLIDVSNLSAEKLPDGSIAKTYVEKYKSASKLGGVHDKAYKILNYFPVDVKIDKTVKELSDKFEKQYPMLKFVKAWNYTDPEVAKYIAEREGEVS